MTKKYEIEIDNTSSVVFEGIIKVAAKQNKVEITPEGAIKELIIEYIKANYQYFKE